MIIGTASPVRRPHLRLWAGRHRASSEEAGGRRRLPIRPCCRSLATQFFAESDRWISGFRKVAIYRAGHGASPGGPRGPSQEGRVMCRRPSRVGLPRRGLDRWGRDGPAVHVIGADSRACARDADGFGP